MRVVRNVGHIKRRKRIAKWSAIGGVAMLGSTFWLALEPRFVLVAYVPLLLGTLIFHYGMQQVARWNRNPRNDQLLDQRLHELSDKFTLIHYAVLGKQAIDHQVVHPGGVLVVGVRELPGTVSYRDGHWRKRGGGALRFFGLGGPQLGNPSFEVQRSVAAVETYLTAEQAAVDVDGVIAFLNPMVEIDVEEPDFPVTNADGLVEYLRSFDSETAVHPNERQALVDLLAKGEELELPQRAQRRRPVKKRAA